MEISIQELPDFFVDDIQDYKKEKLDADLMDETINTLSMNVMHQHSLQRTDLRQISPSRISLDKNAKNFKRQLNKAYRCCFLSPKEYPIQHPKILKYFLKGLEDDEYEDGLTFLQEKGVNMSYAFKVFLKSHNLLDLDSDDLPTSDKGYFQALNERFEKQAKAFLDKGAKVDDRFDLEAGFTNCFSALDFAIYKYPWDPRYLFTALHLIDDINDLKITFFGIEYNLCEILSRINGDDPDRSLNCYDKAIFEMLQKSNLQERFVFPKGSHSTVESSLSEFYKVLVENDLVLARQIIRERKIDLNVQYFGFESPIGLDLLGYNLPFDVEDNTPIISPEMFELFLEEGLNITDDHLFLCKNNQANIYMKNSNTIAADIMRQTYNFEYLKIMAKYGYDFTKVTNQPVDSKLTEILLIDVLSLYILPVKRNAYIDQNVINFIKYLVENKYIDCQKMLSIIDFDDAADDLSKKYENTLAGFFEQFYEKTWENRCQSNPHFNKSSVDEILDLLKP